MIEFGPGVVVHTCNLRTLEAKARRTNSLKASLGYLARVCLKTRKKSCNFWEMVLFGVRLCGSLFIVLTNH
jgi:hypothetical protein